MMENFEKMLQGVMMILCIVGCTAFCPKVLVVKGLRGFIVLGYFIGGFKNGHFVKPFVGKAFAIFKNKVRHLFWVSHFVSFFASKPVGQMVLACSRFGEMRQPFWGVANCLVVLFLYQLQHVAMPRAQIKMAPLPVPRYFMTIIINSRYYAALAAWLR